MPNLLFPGGRSLSLAPQLLRPTFPSSSPLASITSSLQQVINLSLSRSLGVCVCVFWARARGSHLNLLMSP